LSEELDNFARSLRIKEHFGSKEVEGGDEVSSDSDSEDACDFRFVKKSKWVPKPVFLDPKASSEIIKFLRQCGLVDGTRNWAEIKTP
jgi:hypothetical protein